MEKVLLFAIVVTVLFAIFKVFEAKFIDKETKPLKFFVRDAAIVFATTFVVAYIFFNYDYKINEFFAVVTDTKVLTPETTEVFTGDPGF